MTNYTPGGADPEVEAFATALARFRRDVVHMSQDVFGPSINYSVSAVGMFERAQQVPTRRFVRELRGAFGETYPEEVTTLANLWPAARMAWQTRPSPVQGIVTSAHLQFISEHVRLEDGFGDDDENRPEDLELLADFIGGLLPYVTDLLWALPDLRSGRPANLSQVEPTLWRLARLVSKVDNFKSPTKFSTALTARSRCAWALFHLHQLLRQTLGWSERDRSRLRIALGSVPGQEMHPFLEVLEKEHPTLMTLWVEIFDDCIRRGSHAFPKSRDFPIDPDELDNEEGDRIHSHAWWNTCKLHRIYADLDLVSATLTGPPDYEGLT